MKIIFIFTKSITFNTFLKPQVEYFTKKGLQVQVACADPENIKIKNNLKHKIDFPTKILNLFNLNNYINVFNQIKILVRKNPNSIFYLHTPVASHLFRFFNFFKKLKIIYFVHGFRFTSKSHILKKIFFKTIEKILSFKTDVFITINNEDYCYAKLNFQKKKSKFYKINGVGLNLTNYNLKKKIKYKKEIKKILVIAAYKKEKGYLEILKVAEMLKNQKLEIVCYGSGEYSKYNLIKTKKKINNIFFNNFDENLSNKIKNFDILLHLSKREGLPVSVMQSLSEGLPVICYDIRGNNDLIKNNFNGYFVKSFKDVPNRIHYLKLESDIFNKMRLNAFKSINKDFLKKEINWKLLNIIKNYQKN